MAVRGRKPKPTAVKILAGNPGKRRLPKGEPNPALDIPVAPPGMRADALEEWSIMAGEAYQIGISTVLDRVHWIVLADTLTIYFEAMEKVRETGLVAKAPKSDYPIQNPYLPIRNRALSDFQKLAAEMGLSATARTRVATAPTKPDAGRPKTKPLKSGLKLIHGGKR